MQKLKELFNGTLYTIVLSLRFAVVTLWIESFFVCFQVKLVVVDSVASPFRHGFTDMGLRTRILSGLAQNLIRVAVQSRIAVSLASTVSSCGEVVSSSFAV